MIGRNGRPGLALGVAIGLGAMLPLAGCGDDPDAPQVVAFQPPDYSYLTKLRLNVAQVTVDDSWVPAVAPGQPQHVESLSPVSPVVALRTMAQQRVLPGGSAGSARLVIEDASILQGPERLDGSFAVRLDVDTSDGARAGFAEAKVVRGMSLGDATDGGRATAYALVRQMMEDMNVEFEYQVRHSLRDYLQTTNPVAAPAPVQSQDLAPPGAVGAGPLPLSGSPVAAPSPTMSPPPSLLQPPPYNAPAYVPPGAGPTPLSP